MPVAAELFFLDSSPNGRGGRFLEHRDGHLMCISGREIFDSKDAGRTWSEPRRFDFGSGKLPVSNRDVIRLESGRLGLLGAVHEFHDDHFETQQLLWWLSSDEGKTWEGPVSLNPGSDSGMPYSGGALLQMANGRLVLPVRNFSSGHGGMVEAAAAKGRVGGREYKLVDHARFPEFEAAFCYFSDDEGKTWLRSEGEIMIWLDDGRRGAWSMDEPCVVEGPPGRLAMYGRTTLGRIYRSISLDGGLRWSEPEPTELASSTSPCRIVRMPTGPLLAVWNQLSGPEIRSGRWRGRLSCALSHDHGETWHSFQVIDRQGVPARGRIVPEAPAMTRPAGQLDELGKGYGNVTYPTIGFYRDEVIIRYKRRVYWPRRKNSDRMLIIPASWFDTRRQL